jgi:hypothetical protein
MKKLIVLFSAIAFACSVNAQTPTTQTAPATGAPMQHKMKDMVMMRQGKMMMMKDGKWAPMDKEMTMSDGTKVGTDGAVTMKDGTKKMMADGDRMDTDGKMMPGRKMMNNKMAPPPQPNK